jgi:hypothetical protein
LVSFRRLASRIVSCIHGIVERVVTGMSACCCWQ